MSSPLQNLTIKEFREQLNSDFKVVLDGARTVVLQLFDAVEGKTSPKAELFSLYFRGPFTPLLRQQIHRMEHDKLGAVEIFITPIEASPENGTVYESVFHRFRK
jgi:hypothetical protein